MAAGVLLAYVVGFFVTARIAYIRLDRSTPNDDGNGFGATALGLFWPLVLVLITLTWIWDHTIGRETPRQREKRLAEERETLAIERARLIAEAKRLGIDVPDLEVPL
jgi:hypothetical protein